MTSADRRRPRHHQGHEQSGGGGGGGGGGGSRHDGGAELLGLLDDGTSSPAIKREEEVTGLAARRRQLLLAFLVLGYVVFSVVARVCAKLNANAYGTRLVFAKSQFIELFWCIYVTSIVVFTLCNRPGVITEAMHRYPKRLILVMGFLDAFADFLGNVGSVNTPGAWQVLLSQLTIPFTMLFSFAIIRSRFHRVEYAGAAAIIAGSVVAVMPLFTGGGNGGGETRWYSVVIFLASIAPSSASSVFKERAFKAVAFDIFYLSAMVTWTQLVLSWMFVPLLSLKGFGGIPLHDIPGTMRDGFYCLLGHEDIPVFDEDKLVGHCSSYVTRVTFLDSAGDFFAGVFQLMLVKHGSAVLYVLAAALALPLSNMAFSWRLIMSDDVESFSWYDVGGLVLVMAGFFTYRSRQLALLWRTRTGSPRRVNRGDDAEHGKPLLPELADEEVAFIE